MYAMFPRFVILDYNESIPGGWAVLMLTPGCFGRGYLPYDAGSKYAGCTEEVYEYMMRFS